VEGVLWPLLLEFLLQPEYTAAVAAISKALTMVAGRRVAAEGGGLAVAYQNLQVSSVADPMKFWYGSGSLDPFTLSTDPDPNPALFFSAYQMPSFFRFLTFEGIFTSGSGPVQIMTDPECPKTHGTGSTTLVPAYHLHS
jgi:hypothetical protein